MRIMAAWLTFGVFADLLGLIVGSLRFTMLRSEAFRRQGSVAGCDRALFREACHVRARSPSLNLKTLNPKT